MEALPFHVHVHSDFNTFQTLVLVQAKRSCVGTRAKSGRAPISSSDTKKEPPSLNLAWIQQSGCPEKGCFICNGFMDRLLKSFCF